MPVKLISRRDASLTDQQVADMFPGAVDTAIMPAEMDSREYEFYPHGYVSRLSSPLPPSAHDAHPGGADTRTQLGEFDPAEFEWFPTR